MFFRKKENFFQIERFAAISSLECKLDDFPIFAFYVTFLNIAVSLILRLVYQQEHGHLLIRKLCD